MPTFFLVLCLAGGLLGVVPSSLAQPPQDPWRLQDERDDTYLQDPGTRVKHPTTPLNAYADLLKIEIDQETEVDFRVTFFFSDLKPYVPDLVTEYSPQADRLRLAFELESASVHYTLDAILHRWQAREPGFATQISRAALCLRDQAGACYPQGVATSIDYDNNYLQILVPKFGLLGRGDGPFFWQEEPRLTSPPPETPQEFGIGNALHRFTATYEPYEGADAPIIPRMAPVGWYDIVSGSAETPFVFQQPTANLFLTFFQFSSHEGFVEIEPGVATRVYVTLHAFDGPKRLVNLSYGVEGPEKAGRLVTITGPPSTAVSPSKWAEFLVNITLGTESGTQAPVYVTIRGQNVARPDEVAYVKVRLKPIFPLGPTLNKLYFHVKNSADPLCTTWLLYCEQRFWMNGRAQDPRETPNAEYALRFSEIAGTMAKQSFSVHLDEELAEPVAFDGARSIQFRLVLKSPLSGDVNLHAFLDTVEQGTIGESDQMVHLDASTTLDLSIPVSSGNLLIPNNEYLRLEVVLSSDATNPQGWALLTHPEGLRLVAKDSLLTLPLTSLPETFKTGSRLAPFVLRARNGIQEEFVNPGEGHIFNVTVKNLGDHRDTVRIRASIDQPSWSLRLLPGNDFILDPGDSIVLGVLAEAPQGTPEGTNAAIRLNATSDRVPNEAAFLRLTLTSTSGADVPDDSKSYRVDPEAKEKLVNAGPGKKSTPGFEAVFLLGSLLAFALRRRSQNK